MKGEQIKPLVYWTKTEKGKMEVNRFHDNTGELVDHIFPNVISGINVRTGEQVSGKDNQEEWGALYCDESYYSFLQECDVLYYNQEEKPSFEEVRSEYQRLIGDGVSESEVNTIMIEQSKSHNKSR